MSGCKTYSMRPLEKFSLSLNKVVKSHYKKNVRARDSFQALVKSYIEILREDPFFDNSNSENFPKGCYKPDFDFRKIRFSMPELEGASRLGRFMYVVHKASCSVFPMWVYTHEEYPKRPSDSEIENQLFIIEQQISIIPPSIDSIIEEGN